MKRLFISIFVSLLFCTSLFAQKKMSIFDFYYINDNKKYKLGDSLMDFDVECNIKETKIITIGYSEYRVFDYNWGKIYTSVKSDNNTIFGIEINKNEGAIKGGVMVGSKKEFVINNLGYPYYIKDNSFYYYNDDFDVLELRISFNENNIINEISFFMGT